MNLNLYTSYSNLLLLKKKTQLHRFLHFKIERFRIYFFPNLKRRRDDWKRVEKMLDFKSIRSNFKIKAFKANAKTSLFTHQNSVGEKLE
jgi:hypothetical protein